MTMSFQRPLFWPHLLDQELERRQRLAAECSREAIRGERLNGEWIQEAVSSAQIRCLWLAKDPLATVVEPLGSRLRSGEPISSYTRRYRFLGDEQLWHMSPDVEFAMPLGELSRGELIVTVLASSVLEAQLCFDRRLDAVRSVIERQCERIAEFERGLHDSLQLELIQPAVLPN